MVLKKAFLLILAVAAVVILPACWPWASKTESSKEAKLLVLDVNDADVYNDAHIKGAVNVSFDKIEEFIKPYDKNIEIIVHCSNYLCGTSGMVWKKLQELGYKNSFVYEGGTAEWYQLAQADSSYKLEGPATMDFLKMKVEKPEGPAEAQAVTAQDLKQKIDAQKSEHSGCSACRAA